MTTIPARLARATKTSSNPTEARKRVISLYRDWYRSAPEICTLYALNISPAYLRHAIRQRFERNRSITDPKIVDVLIAKERMEYQETMNCWKMHDQLLGLFIQGDGGKAVEGNFLHKFYQGRDEQAVRPAATGM